MQTANTVLRIAVVVTLATIVAACTALPAPHTYTGRPYVNSAYAENPYAGRDATTEGRDYCNDIAKTTRHNAIQHRQAGWWFGGFSLAFAGTGIAVGASDQPEDQAGKNRYKATVAAAPLAAALLAYLAGGQFTMADNSQTLASAATTAHNLRDEEANVACNAALADWEDGSRQTAAAITDAVTKLRTDSGANDGASLKVHVGPSATGGQAASPTPASTSVAPPKDATP